MKYIIMCGGKYNDLEYPKWLSLVYGEKLIDRTIRLLKEKGIKDIYLSGNSSYFRESYKGCKLLEHENNFEIENGKKIKGYWLEAFYPSDEPVTYLYGDVYYSEEAIMKIVDIDTKGILMYGSKNIKENPYYFKEWEEPFAFKVKDQHHFRVAIEICKMLCDDNKTDREPISWELYRVLNNYDINTHIIGDNYIAIDDYTTDIDSLEDIGKLEGILHEIHNTHVS